MNEEEKKAIEYLKTRLHGNEGCKYIDVSQEDLRIFINLVDRKEKDIEGWKKYCEEIEEEQTEMSNKNCELEFEAEKLQKENEELKSENRRLKVIRYSREYGTENIHLITKSDLVQIDINKYMIEIEKGKFVDLKQVYQENIELKNNIRKNENELEFDVDCDWITLQKILDESEKSNEYILYKNEKWIKEKYCIPVQKIKDKIEELNSRIEKYREYVKQGIETDVEWVDNVADRETVKVLQELLESEDSKDGENKKSTNTIRNSRA